MIIFSVTSVYVSVCPVRTFTFESLDLVTSFLVRCRIFRISRSNSYIKVKVKITGAKNVSVCPVWALTFKWFDLQT